MVGGRGLFARPTLLDDLQQFFRDIDAPAVQPAILEPARKFLAGVLIEDIDVQFTLFVKAGERQVAAAQKADDGAVGIGSKGQIELRVERVPQEKLDDDFLPPDLPCEPAQAGLVLVRRRADHELVPELAGQAPLEPQRRPVVELAEGLSESERIAQIVLGRALHADQHAATTLGTAGPNLDQVVNRLPSAKVEIAHAEVGALRNFQSAAESGKQAVLDVVEYPRHFTSEIRLRGLAGSVSLSLIERQRLNEKLAAGGERRKVS